MRIVSYMAAGLGFLWLGCGTTANVDDLFDPNPTGAAGTHGGSGGQTGGSSGSGGAADSGGGSGAGGADATAGSGGTGGGTGGNAGTGGSSGSGGRSGTGGSSGGGAAGTSIDSGADARADGAGDTSDAGPPGIRCDMTTCRPSAQFCCLSDSNVRCVSTGGACGSDNDRLRCDDAADCPIGQYCCVTPGTSGAGDQAACALSCIAPRQVLCDPTALAPCFGVAIPGAVCSANNSGLVPDYPYCHAP